MYSLVSRLQNLPIISLQTGHSVASTIKPIVNPDQLEVVAFYCAIKGRLNLQAVLLTQDIRQTAKDGIVINSIDEIQNPDDIIRLKALLKKTFTLHNMPVNNESGVRLGRVEEYTVNLDTFKIQKIYVKQSLFKNFILNSLVIDRSQIIEVTTQYITVRDAFIKKALLSPHPSTPPPL